MEVNSPRDRLSSGALQLNFTHPRPHTNTHTHTCTRAPESGRRSHRSRLFRTYHCGFSCGPFPGAGADPTMLVGRRWLLCSAEWCFGGFMVNSLAEEADPPPHQLRVWKRGKEWERGSKLVSGMDSLKWIVLGDIALTFVQSAVLRDLPVCFNSAALAKFSWAAEGI